MVNDLQQLKRHIAGKIIKRNDYDWIKPIIDKTLDEETLEYLTNNNPDSTKYYLLKVEDHLSEANSLVNFCIAKRSEVFDLESVALLKAVEYLEVDGNLDNDNLLGALNLKAAFVQSNEADITPYADALKDKSGVVKLILDAKLALHNQKGSSLNYGERVTLLRKQYADAVKVLYERLIAIKRTLLHSFGQKTDSIPNYIDISKNVYTLQDWLKKTVYDFEYKEQTDVIEIKTIFYCTKEGINSSDKYHPLYGTLLNSTSFDFTIEVTEADLNFDPLTESIRLVSVSVNVLNEPRLMTETRAPMYDVNKPDFGNYYLNQKAEELRISIFNSNDINIRRTDNYQMTNYITKLRSMLLGCKVTPPQQIMVPLIEKELFNVHSDDGAKERITNIHPKIHTSGTRLGMSNLSDIGDITVTEGMSPNLKPSFYTNKNIFNINPIGKWIISIANTSKENYGFFTNGPFTTLGVITDVSISLKVIKRKL